MLKHRSSIFSNTTFFNPELLYQKKFRTFRPALYFKSYYLSSVMHFVHFFAFYLIPGFLTRSGDDTIFLINVRSGDDPPVAEASGTPGPKTLRKSGATSPASHRVGFEGQ